MMTTSMVIVMVISTTESNPYRKYYRRSNYTNHLYWSAISVRLVIVIIGLVLNSIVVVISAINFAVTIGIKQRADFEFV